MNRRRWGAALGLVSVAATLAAWAYAVRSPRLQVRWSPEPFQPGRVTVWNHGPGAIEYYGSPDRMLSWVRREGTNDEVVGLWQPTSGWCGTTDDDLWSYRLEPGDRLDFEVTVADLEKLRLGAATALGLEYRLPMSRWCPWIPLRSRTYLDEHYWEKPRTHWLESFPARPTTPVHAGCRARTRRFTAR